MDKLPEAKPHSTIELRLKAEEQFRERESVSGKNAELPPEALRTLLHELRVHQIELEIQNEDLHRTQADLEASQARYFDLYEMAPVGYLTVSEKGLIIEANLMAATLLCVERRALVRQPFYRFILKKDQDTFYLLKNTLVEISLAQTCDLQMVKSDGTIFWAHLSASADKDGCGEPACRLVLSDISERKRMEHVAQRSEQFQKDVLNSLPAHIAVLGEGGKVLAVNEPWLRFASANGNPAIEQIGVGANYLEACRSSAADGDPHAQTAIQAIAAVLSGNQKLFQFEYPCNAPDRPRWFAMEVHRAEGDIASAIVAHTDITERKQAEESLLVKNLVFDASLAANSIADNAGILIEANDSFLKIWGYSNKEDVVGKPVCHFFHDPSVSAGILAELRETGRWEGQFTGKRGAGESTFIALAVATTLRDTHGRITGFQSSVLDISERKRMEEALQKKTDEMEHFTYTVSHDLKSPLVTIKTFLGYLEADHRAKNVEAADKDLEFIHRAADKMGCLLEELLKVARCGLKNNEPVKASLQQVVDDALSMVAGQIAERGVLVHVTEEPVCLTCDRPRIIEVFQNLLDNAVKFLGDQPHPRIEIGAVQVGNELQISVRDNGQGIDPRHQSKIFGMFEKLDANISGSGLGLALVRRIVELHGGKIWVESAGLGHGTTFRFTLAKTERNPAS